MEHYPEQEAISPSAHIKWILALIFALSIAAVFGLANSGEATAYGLTNLTTSSPLSPLPAPNPAGLLDIEPSQGVNSVVVYVNVYGRNLRNGGQLYLRYSSNQQPAAGETERPLIPIYSQVINSTKMIARIPARGTGLPLKPGYYDFVLAYADQRQLLEKAYRVFDAESVNDLYAESYHLSTVPNQLWAGEETKLTVRVQRLGGQGGTGPFDVDFYQDSITPENFIGRATVPGISPNGAASSSMVAWTPQTHGRVKIITVIDPTQVVAETNEDNNLIVTERRVSIPQTEDRYPPVISNLQINGGLLEVYQSQVQLTTTLEDGIDPANPNALVSGPSRVYYVELHWYTGIGSGNGSWIPVNWTGWLPYDATPDDFELHPKGGVRYLQAWGADAAGNISNLPDGRRLNYIPEEDDVAAGEIRVYRQEVEAGRCLSVELTPAQADMDADLYVWGPDGSLQGFSINGAGLHDSVYVQPTETGSYQIEVEGFTDAHYHLSISVQDTCGIGNTDDNGTLEGVAKTTRMTPAIPVDNSPTVNEAPLPQEEIGQLFSFLPAVTSGQIGNQLQMQEMLFLPILNGK
ncbi:hypothetical protein GC175_18835 [bacterium]|nr:hypothetical protein [bacterium]